MKNLLAFAIGIVTGFILCLLIWLLAVVTSLKRSEKKAKASVKPVENETIEHLIGEAKRRYDDEASAIKTGEKPKVLKTVIADLVYNIAVSYYPDSKYPLCELSVDEIIALDYYIMQRIEKIFDRRILSALRPLKITSIMKLIDMKKKFDENKAVRAIQKAKLPEITKGIIAAVNIVNPVYWVKKATIGIPMQLLSNRIANVIIDVVGQETANVYSKNAFAKDDETEKITAGEKNE